MDWKERMINKYSKRYGVSKEIVRKIIKSGIKNGMSKKQIDLGIRLTLGSGKGELFTVDDVATATGMTREEAQRYVEEHYYKMKREGINPESYGIYKITLH